MNFSFNEETHTYTLDGFILPGVTQILKNAGLSDFGFVSEEILKSSSIFGTAVHAACEYYDKDMLDPESLDPMLRPYLDAWVRFKLDTGFICQEIEKAVYSKRYNFAGRLDRIFLKKNKIILLDIKTSKNILPVVGLQLAGYQIAYEEMTKKKIKERWVVSLQENKYKITMFDDPSDKNVFLGCVNICHWKNR